MKPKAAGTPASTISSDSGCSLLLYKKKYFLFYLKFFIYWRSIRIVDIVFISSVGPPDRPVPGVEFVLFCDDDFVNDEANFTDLTSSALLPVAVLNRDGLRDTFDSSALVTFNKSLTNSSKQTNFIKKQKIPYSLPSESKPLSLKVEINIGGIINSLFKHFKYKALS